MNEYVANIGEGMLLAVKSKYMTVVKVKTRSQSRNSNNPEKFIQRKCWTLFIFRSIKRVSFGHPGF